MSELGDVLIRIRKSLGLTQRGLVGAVGIRQNTISQYETGRAVPGIGVLLRLHALAPEGPEKQFLHDYVGDRLRAEHPEHSDLVGGVLESLTSREELLKKITPPKGRPDPQLQRFAELCSRLLNPDSQIDPSINDILELWDSFGNPEPSPRCVKVFRRAADWINVELAMLSDEGFVDKAIDANRKRMQRRKASPPKKGH